MVFCRSSSYVVVLLRGELEVVGLVTVSQNDSVKAIMICKLGENSETKTPGIHLGDECQVVRWSGDAQYEMRLHDFFFNLVVRQRIALPLQSRAYLGNGPRQAQFCPV